MHAIQCITYSVRHALYSVRPTSYSVHYALYIVNQYISAYIYKDDFKHIHSSK